MAIIIVTVVLVSIIIGVILHNNSQKNVAEFDSEQIYSDYIEINEEALDIEDKYSADGFIKPENISSVLDDLEILAKEYKSKGLITSYDKQSTSIYFKLNSGIGYLYTPTVEELLAGDDIGKILTIEPYATSPEFVSNYLLGGKSPDKAAEKIVAGLPNCYSFSKDDNWDSFSFEQVEQMGNHKIIIWYGHGGYVEEYGSVLGTSIPIKDQTSLLLYQLELSNGEMILGKDCFCISPSYFEKHLEDNSLEGSLVFLGACQSAMDNRLAEIFINKGASLVVGNSQTIRIRYMLYMMDDFMSALTNQYDDGTYWTAEDALAYAKSQNGDSDSEFWAYGAEVKLIYPENKSEYRLYNSEQPNNENSYHNTSTETATPQQPETKLSEECDMILCTGYDGSDYYELVANQIDNYPQSSILVGVIKNNTWLIELSTSSPFLNEKSWWKTSSYYDKIQDKFIYLDEGCFLLKNDGVDDYDSIIYKPATKVSFDVAKYSIDLYRTADYSEIDYSKIVNKDEFVAISPDGELRVYNMNTGNSNAIKGYFSVDPIRSPDALRGISEGLFYASGDTEIWHNFDFVQYCGFFDINGNMVIDLSDYSIANGKDFMFEQGKYTITVRNENGVNFDITFDISGKIIDQEKSKEQ